MTSFLTLQQVAG